MAQGDASDLMMMFVPSKGGDAIAAESRTGLLLDGPSVNPLVKGFRPGHMFEITKFTFKAGTSGDEGHAAPAAAKAKAAPAKPASSALGGYQGWRAGKSIKYPVDLQPVSFTRDIDSASSILLQHCIDCVSFDSATLIKRKAVGNAAAGEAFLRFDFTGVLVVAMDWSDDSEISETCRFICRSVTVSYRPQLPDGSLGAIVAGFWSMVPGETQVTL